MFCIVCALTENVLNIGSNCWRLGYDLPRNFSCDNLCILTEEACLWKERNTGNHITASFHSHVWFGFWIHSLLHSGSSIVSRNFTRPCRSCEKNRMRSSLIHKAYAPCVFIINTSKCDFFIPQMDNFLIKCLGHSCKNVKTYLEVISGAD